MRKHICLSALLFVFSLSLMGCSPAISKENFDSIQINKWTRQQVHEKFGEPGNQAVGADLPDREVFYPGDRIKRPYFIIYYDGEGPDAKVVHKQWKGK